MKRPRSRELLERGLFLCQRIIIVVGESSGESLEPQSKAFRIYVREAISVR